MTYKGQQVYCGIKFNRLVFTPTIVLSENKINNSIRLALTLALDKNIYQIMTVKINLSTAIR